LAASTVSSATTMVPSMTTGHIQASPGRTRLSMASWWSAS
jgi:hypothetical protein